MEGILGGPDVGSAAGDAVFAAQLVVDEGAGFGVRANVGVGIEDSVLSESEQEANGWVHVVRLSSAYVDSSPLCSCIAEAAAATTNQPR